MRNNDFRTREGGRLLNRDKRVSFDWNGTRLFGYEGDTLASALLANGVHFVGRSYKYHRPRGITTAGPEEPNALVGTGQGGRFDPNQRATLVELYEGLYARSQNHWPSLNFDLGALNQLGSRFFSAGFYYKTFMWPRPFWKHVYEPIIRRIAGLGAAPTQRDPDRYEHFYYTTDVLVVGAGAAGLVAAREAAEAGAQVLLVEQNPHVGGRLLTDEVMIGEQTGVEWVNAQLTALRAMPNVRVLTRATAAAHYDHNYCLVYERVGDHAPKADGLRHRLWRVRAGKVIVCAGAIERPLAFACNDVPGVMLASAMRDYLALYGVRVGQRVVLATNNDDAYRTAIMLQQAGVAVAAVLDSRMASDGALVTQARQAGIPVRLGAGIAKVLGKKRVSGVIVTDLRGSGRVGSTEEIACDAVGMSGGWSPVVHLWSHSGGKLNWDAEAVMFRPDPKRPPLTHDGSPAALIAGGANGHLRTADVLADAARAGREAAQSLGYKPNAVDLPVVSEPEQAPIQPLWFTPSFGGYAHGGKHFLDYQHDVTVADIELAAREGYESVEHAKRYTTLGMATDQGKLSNINGLAILADALNKPIAAVGTTTFRPPYVPISMGSITGAAKGELFKPVRKTPMAAWHQANGADWEPVGDWRRPFCYRRAGEGRHEAVNREILAVRGSVGMVDASTLGKIIVKGPDAGKFLDLLYTNVMSNLKVGRCRYGLMCNENGFLFDDGVVVRLSDDSFLCHTTSGGADRVHAWMEEWLQTEWWDLKVYVANVTEQYSQIAVAGPKARAVLEKLNPSMDLSAAAFPFMAMAEGQLAGLPVRIYRISFSGELGYEIAVPASAGLALWEKLLEAGGEFGITPYGTEALHVLRAEKGFIMIGDETDGTVTPHDLGLSGLVSKKKDDFIGKRAMARSYLAGSGRKQLVGLETEDPKQVIPHGAYAVAEVLPKPPMKMIGQVTSSYWSPTLGRSIAMALIENGASRLGETLSFPMEGGQVIRAKVVAPVFYDKEGERQNV